MFVSSHMMASPGILKLLNATLASAEFEADTTASIELLRNGTVDYTTLGGSPPDPTDEWIDPPHSTIGDLYECRLTLVSGDGPTSGPAANVFHTINTGRLWALTTSGVENLDGVWDIDIGHVGKSTPLVTGRFTMSASHSI